jgi:hypothetical protein
MSERLKFLGRLEEAKIDARKLELAIKDHRITLRELLDPFAEPGKLDGERIAMRAVQLAADLIAYRRVNRVMADLRQELGIDETQS